ncbi:hypothetical protein [Desulfovibrio cuneatus]|uniref:hypothetical protein n=1 Tax=Desulfovibrio cuneatus TaxID=159728 RepID=UPI0003FB0937|nr:hypothetical protein [Desulfovibrio cuneatus]
MNALFLLLRPACFALYAGLFLLCSPALALAAPVNQSMLDYDDYTDAAKTTPKKRVTNTPPKASANPMQPGQTILLAPLRVLMSPAPKAAPQETAEATAQAVPPINSSMAQPAAALEQQFIAILMETLAERGLRAEMAVPTAATTTEAMPLPPLRDVRDEQNKALALPKEAKQAATKHKAPEVPTPLPGTGTLGGELEITPALLIAQEPEAKKKEKRRLRAEAAATLRYSILLEIPGSKAMLLRGEKQGAAALHIPFTQEQETQATLGATTQKLALQRLAQNVADALMGQLPVPQQATKAKTKGKKRSR